MNDSRQGQSSPWKSAAALGLVAVIGTALLAGVHLLTRDRIAEQEHRVVLEQLNQLVAPERYDNAFHTDLFRFTDEAAFPGGQTVTAYRARRGGRPEAVVLRVTAPDGYSGPITLLVGINASGTLSGVRIVAHQETPGLGDAIELQKSDWVLDFDGQGLESPPVEDWRVRRDGGTFDQFTGATITPRAVVDAVRRTLQYFADHREFLFEHPAEPQD